jgi:hypothetical protein
MLSVLFTFYISSRKFREMARQKAAPQGQQERLFAVFVDV